MCFEESLPLGVVFARQTIVVPSSAIGFEDEPHFRPAKVRNDLSAVQQQRHVYVWHGKTSAGQEIEDSVFKHTASRRETGR